MEDYLLEDKEVFDHTSPKDIKSFIQYDFNLKDSSVNDSTEFRLKKEFIYDIFNFEIKREPILKICEDNPKSEILDEQFSDKVIITSWKNVENISARIVDSYDSSVILECLIDKEIGIYEEREFRASLFEGYEIKQGNLFYLRIFERKNEVKLEIHDDPGLTRIEDFPKMDFFERFSKSRLFKNKKQT
jgi:hypothetical protein